jgi:D-inositol-3-phosphate glycosyltransferase
LRTSALQLDTDPKPKDFQVPGRAARVESAPIHVALLTGGMDRHYTYGLAMSLAADGIRLDVAGSDGVDGPEMHDTPGLTFLNFQRGKGRNARALTKVSKLLGCYMRLIAYAWKAKPEIFHILWNNRIQLFDRTILMLYYKALGKKVVLTAHNVNKAKRDGGDSLVNHLSLKMQYRLADHIFVHTDKMKNDLLNEFGVPGKAATVIPYGINNAVPSTDLTPVEARDRLGISRGEKTILFFGNLRASKGLDYLLSAFEQLHADDPRYRLIVAGHTIKGDNEYLRRVRVVMRRLEQNGSLILRNEFIPDDDISMYFAAADVVALPYTEIFQSGVLFLAYSFGLPVVATDVGSLRNDIIEGRTGFICKPRDAASLAGAIKKYFESDLHRELDDRKQEIRDYARARHSWSDVAAITQGVYRSLAGNRRLGVG